MGSFVRIENKTFEWRGERGTVRVTALPPLIDPNDTSLGRDHERTFTEEELRAIARELAEGLLDHLHNIAGI